MKLLSSLHPVLLACTFLPLTFSLTPAARWGQQSVYIESVKSLYVVGGEVSATGNQITNEVLILPVSLALDESGRN
jgi:hypothetical protein